MEPGLVRLTGPATKKRAEREREREFESKDKKIDSQWESPSS